MGKFAFSRCYDDATSLFLIGRNENGINRLEDVRRGDFSPQMWSRLNSSVLLRQHCAYGGRVTICLFRIHPHLVLPRAFLSCMYRPGSTRFPPTTSDSTARQSRMLPWYMFGFSIGRRASDRALPSKSECHLLAIRVEWNLTFGENEICSHLRIYLMSWWDYMQ